MSCECGTVGRAQEHDRYCSVHPERQLDIRIADLEAEIAELRAERDILVAELEEARQRLRRESK